MPRVSVCIAVYNGAASLAAALDSVVAQTYADYDILVLDDGSTDDSADIAAQYSCRLIRQPNAGLGAARKRMVEEAAGDLIAFIDHDDEWLPQKLEKQIPLHGRPDVVLSHTAGLYEHEDGRRWTRVDDVDPSAPSWDQVFPLKIIASTAVFNREAMLRGGNFASDVRICSDWYGWYLLAAQGSFEYLAEPLVRYRVRSAANSAPGLRFFEADRYVMEEKFLPTFDRMLAEVPPERRNAYRRWLIRSLGKTKRSIAHFARLEGNRPLAMRMHREAIACDPFNVRYWASYAKNALRWKP